MAFILANNGSIVENLFLLDSYGKNLNLTKDELDILLDNTNKQILKDKDKQIQDIKEYTKLRTPMWT